MCFVWVLFLLFRFCSLLGFTACFAGDNMMLGFSYFRFVLVVLIFYGRHADGHPNSPRRESAS